jgi:hypothetical protein
MYDYPTCEYMIKALKRSFTGICCEGRARSLP